MPPETKGFIPLQHLEAGKVYLMANSRKVLLLDGDNPELFALAEKLFGTVFTGWTGDYLPGGKSKIRPEFDITRYIGSVALPREAAPGGGGAV